MCDLPRHVRLSRERIHFVSLICLADLSVRQRSVHSMFDLFSVIQWFLWWPSSLTSFICDFLTAEPWQMSTGGFCSCGLEDCCSELSPCFSVAGCCHCGRISRRTECLRHWIQSPAAGIPLIMAFCRAAGWWMCVTGNRLVLPGDCAARTAVDREGDAGRSYSLPAICKDVRQESLTGILVCALKQAGDLWGVLWRAKRLALSLSLLGLSVAEQPQQGTLPWPLHLQMKLGLVYGNMARKVRCL